MSKKEMLDTGMIGHDCCAKEREYKPTSDKDAQYFEEKCEKCGLLLVHGVEYEDGLEELFVLF